MHLIGRRHGTQPEDSRQKGNLSKWIRVHTAALKTLSRYALQHNLSLSRAWVLHFLKIFLMLSVIYE